MAPERRLAAAAAIALLLTMFLPWYGLQSLNRKTGAIYSHNISAFGDVSFVEAAIFLVAVGVIAMLFARAEGRRLPHARRRRHDRARRRRLGRAADLLPRLQPAGRETATRSAIEWGFFLAFVAAGGLAFAGLRMRGGERPGPPLVRSRRAPRRPPEEPDAGADFDRTAVVSRDPVAPAVSAVEAPAEPARPRPTAPVPAEPRRAAPRPRPSYPPAPAAAPEQLSFEDPPTRSH